MHLVLLKGKHLKKIQGCFGDNQKDLTLFSSKWSNYSQVILTIIWVIFLSIDCKFLLSTITGYAIVIRTISVLMNAHSCMMTTEDLILTSQVFYANTLFFWFLKFWDSHTLRFLFPFSLFTLIIHMFRNTH